MVGVTEVFMMPYILRFIEIEAISFLYGWLQTTIIFISGFVLCILPPCSLPVNGRLCVKQTEQTPCSQPPSRLNLVLLTTVGL